MSLAKSCTGVFRYNIVGYMCEQRPRRLIQPYAGEMQENDQAGSDHPNVSAEIRWWDVKFASSWSFHSSNGNSLPSGTGKYSASRWSLPFFALF